MDLESDTNIPEHKPEIWMSKEIQELRANAHHHLNYLIENGDLGNITSVADLEPGQVTALEGGISSACYFVRSDENPVVVKFRRFGGDAEIIVLRKWHDNGIAVPTIISSGILPNEQTPTDPPTTYLVMEGVTDSENGPAKSGHAFLEQHQDKISALGELMGKELAKIHQLTTNKPFGFIDKEDPQGYTWPEYLQSILSQYEQYLKSFDISAEEIEILKRNLFIPEYPKEGSYLHGDYGLHNVLVESADPLKIKIFDPNPLIGDPYFDLARILYHYETLEANVTDKERTRIYKEFIDSLMKTYIETTGQPLAQTRLEANFLIRALTITRNREKRLDAKITFATGEEKDNHERELAILRDLLRKHIKNSLDLT